LVGGLGVRSGCPDVCGLRECFAQFVQRADLDLPGTFSGQPEPGTDLAQRSDGQRSWAERAYPNLIYFNEVDKGGHFAAWEQPQLFTEELRAAFWSLRQEGSLS
jgi:pimeloyl-ACP methyl ester carboxylesterase